MLARGLSDDSYGRGAKCATILPRVTTRGEARVAATERLRAAGDPIAALDSDLLLAHVCGIEKEQLYSHLDVPLAPADADAYDALVSRRLAGEPVAYLRGWKEFYGLRLAVDPRVLIPRPETEVLVDEALAWIRRRGRARVADVGTGSGAIAIAVASRVPEARIVAIDASADALAVARANVAVHGLAQRIELRHGDLLEPLDEPVDVVAANLPYLRDDAVDHLAAERTSLRFEPRAAVVAGPDGLDLIRRCAAQLPRALAPGGIALFECDPPQADEVARLLGAALGGMPLVVPDLTGAARVAVGERGSRAKPVGSSV